MAKPDNCGKAALAAPLICLSAARTFFADFG